MASIIQQPNTINFSGNINDIIIDSAEPIIASLTHNGDHIFRDEEFVNDSNNKIRFGLNELVSPLITYTPPTTDNIVTSSVDLFIFSTGETSFEFSVINGGVDSDNINTEAFLAGNFLSWQPQSVTTTYYQPQWLRYYAAVNAELKITGYFPDESQLTIKAATLASGVNTINLNYGRVAGLFSGKQPQYYDVWVGDNQGIRLSYIQRYIFRHSSPKDDVFVFQNTLGGFDSVRFTGDKIEEHEVNSSNFSSNNIESELRVDFRKAFKKYTGYISKSTTRIWVLEFFKSSNRHYVDKGLLKRIVVDKPKLESEDYQINNYEFKFALADKSIYLNLPRTETLPEILELSENEELFFLVPRLNEFPAASFDEEVILPAQNLFDKTWRYLSLTKMIDNITTKVIKTIVEILPDPDPGGGGTSGNIIQGEGIEIIATPEGKSRISHGRTSKVLAKYVDKFGHVIQNLFEIFHKKGGDINEDFKSRDLAVRSLRSHEYISGMTGNGMSFGPGSDHNYNGELDNLTIRKSLKVFELTIQRIKSQGGQAIFSPAQGIKVTKVEYLETSWKCYFDNFEGSLRNEFVTGDQAICQEWKPESRYYWGLVTEVGDDYICIDKEDIDGEDIPMEADEIVQCGNRTDRNRQSIILISSVGDDSPTIDVLQGVDSYSLAGKLKVRLGNLEGISTDFWGELKGMGLYTENFYGIGSLIMLNGKDVMTQFEVVQGLIRSSISSIKVDINNKDNYLSNASFSANLDKWNATNNVSLFNAAGQYIYMNNNLYSWKKNIAAIENYNGETVLHILTSMLSQANEHIQKPIIVDDTLPILHLSFQFICKSTGVLTVGFTGSGLFETRTIEAATNKETFEYSGAWDGVGQFVLQFTGEIYITMLSVTEKELDTYKVKLSTLFEQTNDRISLSATKEYVNGLTNSLSSRLDITAGQMSGISSRVNGLESQSSGWITTSGFAQLFSQAIDQNGDKILSAINLTPGHIKIKSNLIELDGRTIADLIQAQNITTGKLTVTTGGTIGGFRVNGQNLICSGGVISGFAWKSRIVSTDIQLGFADDNYINCVNDQQINITLDYNNTGSVLYIRRSGAGNVIIKAAPMINLIRHTYPESQIIMSDRGGMAMLHCSRSDVTGITTWYFNFIGI